MQDDQCLQDGLHSTRAQIAELLDERRAEVANSVVALLKSRNVDCVSPLIVRTLVHALAKAMADSSPDVIVHWSRMIRQAHPAPAVIAMIDAACDAAEELAQNDHGDLATIVVFLEIVKGRARAQIADDLLDRRDRNRAAERDPEPAGNPARSRRRDVQSLPRHRRLEPPHRDADGARAGAGRAHRQGRRPARHR